MYCLMKDKADFFSHLPSVISKTIENISWSHAISTLVSHSCHEAFENYIHLPIALQISLVETMVLVRYFQDQFTFELYVYRVLECLAFSF